MFDPCGRRPPALLRTCRPRPSVGDPLLPEPAPGGKSRQRILDLGRTHGKVGGRAFRSGIPPCVPQLLETARRITTPKGLVGMVLASGVGAALGADSEVKTVFEGSSAAGTFADKSHPPRRA